MISQLFLAALLGGAIGLERESGDKGQYPGAGGGIRTFSLVCLLGALSGIFYVKGLPLVFVVVASAFLALLVAYYILGSNITKDVGLTNEIGFIFTFVLGILLTTGVMPVQLVIALAVVLMLILSFKDQSRKLLSEISRHEVESFISYAIVALVILPFLPNVSYTLSDVPFLSSLLEAFKVNQVEFSQLELINPRKIWLIVVLITGIDVFGYFLGKIVGNKHGFTLASFAGGFVSSTSTTQSLAQKSRHTNIINHLIGAAILANVASFFQLFLLVGPLNARWLVFILPTIIILIVSGAVLAVFFLKRREQAQTGEVLVQRTKIFSLGPAVRFALLLIAVKIITKASLIVFGESGFVISSVIASFAGIDAIMVNLADMAGDQITFQFALITFILINATNLLSKTFYAFLQGSRQFALKFFLSSGVMIALTFSGLLLTK